MQTPRLLIALLLVAACALALVACSDDGPEDGGSHVVPNAPPEPIAPIAPDGHPSQAGSGGAFGG